MTGLTGVASVALVGATPDAPDLVATPGQRYPRIQGDSSDFQNLLENFQSVSVRAGAVLEKLDHLLDENATAFTAVLKNTETFTKTLAANSDNIGNFVRDAAEFAHSLKPVANRFDKLLIAGETTIKAIDPKKLKTIAGEMAGASANLNRFSATGLRQYEQLAVDGRKAVDSIERTVRSLERDPSQVIFGRSETMPEVQGPR
jgi:phospholipid/cholesterol/gamma-HCH transport system substrate-binding protein